MVTPSDNTLDFHSARQQRPASRRQPLPLKPITLADLRQQLTLQLQTSLELDRILAMFFEQVQRLVPLDALSYHNDEAELTLTFGESTTHSASYGLNHLNQFLGEVEFRRRLRFSEEELAQLESLLGALLFPLRNGLLYRDALRNALQDSLTGVGNRLAMGQALQREVDLARRSLQPLSLLMLDIDYFKRINDRYGHNLGDEALRVVAQALKSQLRNVDMVFRYGGEEFLVLLSHTSAEAAAMVGERLRHAVQALELHHNGERVELSISLGCATLLPGESGEQLQERADLALLEAKRDGRNRLRMAS